MRLWTLEQLSQLPEARAVQKHFDRLNYRSLRWAWLFSAFTAFGFFIANSVDGDLLRCLAAFAWMGILFAIYAFRAHPRFEEHFAKIITGFLLATAGVLVIVTPDPEARRILPAALMPMTLLYFRLFARQIVTVASGLVLIAIAAGLTSGAGGFEGDESIFLPLVVNSVFAGMSLFLARQARRAFLEEWIGLASRERERERMSDELADARKIQLAMLPGAAPDVSWLSIASASLPASEVGGDFYDHFLLPDGSIALTIGDVAGHGVGSGLVLAGIKSGLHLLRDELREPVRVLDRLNRLASEWLQWRMLVTLMLAVVDPVARTVRVAAAGHAPLIVVAKDGTTRRVGTAALPLGTKLAPSWREDSATIEEGDLLVFYTDGLSELAGPTGEPYGEERLISSVQEAVLAGEGVDTIRDRILSSLQWFRGDAPQLDDISIVVARFHPSRESSRLSS